MRSERLLLFTLAAINFTHIVDFMIMMPLGPQLMRLFDISPQQFSALVSTYTFSAGIASFAGAFLLDRFDRKRALFVAYAGFVIGTFACALSPSYYTLLTARMVTGSFGGVLSAVILSIIGDVVPYERRATAMGVVMAAFSVASIFGVPAGLYLANLSSWHMPFLCLGLLSLTLFFPIVLIVPTLRSHLSAEAPHPSPYRIITSVALNGNNRSALGFTMMLVLGHFTIIPFFAPFMVTNVGFTESQLTYIYLLGGAVTIFTSPLIGRLADRIGKPKVFTIFALLALLPLFLITNLQHTALPIALLITTVFFVTSNGRWVPAMAMVTSAVAQQNRGKFLSINSAVQQLTAGVAAAFAGSIVTKDASGALLHYHYVGYIAIAVSVLAIFVGRRLQAVG